MLRNSKVHLDAGSYRIGNGQANRLPRQAGDRLPNGSILLIESQPEFHDTEQDDPDRQRLTYVLALNETGYQRFIVWQRIVAWQDTGNNYQLMDYCVSGDYYHRLEDALAGYQDRTGQTATV
jgi:hypothetical protein